jgi:UDP-glucose 4-epimerase
VSAAHALLGAGGVLGSAFEAVLSRAGVVVVHPRPRWDVPGDVAVALDASLHQLLARHSPVTVIWAAGIGHTGADVDAMRGETASVRSMCDLIAQLPAEQRVHLSIVFASSAGALYGGHGESEISELDPPSPISAYGREKLAQEAMLHELAAETGGRVVICRYTNLFGLAGGKLTARGLVSTAVRATRLREPMVVYVNPDTRRDLVYGADAAAESLQILERAGAGVTTALVRDGETRTVSEILALVGRVSGRRVPATYAERPETRLQPKVLRFRRPQRDSRSVRRTPMEVAIHLMLRAPMA